MDVRPRESVILADDLDKLVAWYQAALGFEVTSSFTGDFNYATLDTPGGVKIGIAPAKEMGVEPGERARNTVLLQVEVDDVKAFLAGLPATGGTVAFGPSYEAKQEFWFGAFCDPEGNPWWVVDRDCP